MIDDHGKQNIKTQHKSQIFLSSDTLEHTQKQQTIKKNWTNLWTNKINSPKLGN